MTLLVSVIRIALVQSNTAVADACTGEIELQFTKPRQLDWQGSSSWETGTDTAQLLEYAKANVL
jgi:hypothetical protein